MIFKIFGGLGVLLISIGILLNNRKIENIFYISGGVCLAAYSIYIKDMIFIILQIIFILAATYDLVTIKTKKK